MCIRDSNIRHQDFYPLINPRAHNISKGTGQKLILNREFYRAYGDFIKLLMQKPNWDLPDKMTLTYYLILQDRVAEALKVFGHINGEKEVEKEGVLRLQYDYMTCLLYTSDAADDTPCVDLGGRRIIKKKTLTQDDSIVIESGKTIKCKM
eukprot:TRINITY_DN15617_c0_g1_i3.p2 TRINITY_DN15617_c0_g1~~TRINITY_DN15617_c0_g1_i3.p2  ORF type:complete len:150 (+),score=25.01 TRINITY_DN15617_c0_g1_i3:135-584(+)